MSPNTTPMLPSVSAQKPDVGAPSWVSDEVAVTAMMEKRTLAPPELIQARL